MNVDQLSEQLAARGVPAEAYSLHGGLPNEAYCLERTGPETWRTYYSERGATNSERSFDSETSACSFFLEWIHAALTHGDQAEPSSRAVYDEPHMVKAQLTQSLEFLLQSAKNRQTRQGVEAFEWALQSLDESSGADAQAILRDVNRILLGLESHGDLTDEEFAQVKILRSLEPPMGDQHEPATAMNKFYDEKPIELNNTPINSPDEFFGDGWSVRKDGEKFWFSYISGGLAGQARQVEITAADYELARSGGIGFDGLCTRYNTH
ncbi:MAG: hypothetical protein QGG36_11275 [Pirellulaceae bacterium]|nr:hypothetical protein [Pirellulaceae bacterium]